MSTSDSLPGNVRGIRAPHDFAGSILLRAGLADTYVRTGSPLGDIFVAWNVRGISHVALAKNARAFEDHFEYQFKRRAFATAQVPAGLQRALSGDVQAGRTLTYDICGISDFAQLVLRKALQIPRGEVRPYSWIAAEIGSPKAVRAVGSALARNPVPLLIPCHRVVRSDGMIGNYALGSPNKRRILEREGVKISRAPGGLARAAL